MAVTLSLFAGAGAQFFDNSGNVLSGGKIYTYAAGTTTPLASYTSNSGTSFHTNPIILDAAGRVPSGGEIWLQLGVGYKFVLRTSTDVLIATYDNVPSSAQPPAANDADSIMYEQGYTVTAGSFVPGKIYRIASTGTTDFTLIGATSNTVGTHFIATSVGTGTGTAELSQTVETKLRQTISVKDFGAVGDGVTNDTATIQAALNTGKSVYFPQGVYLVDSLTVPTAARGSTYYGDGYYHYDSNQKTVIKARTLGQASVFTLASGSDNITFSLMRIDGDSKAARCVDASFGAFLSLIQCGVYSGVSYGVYSKQGLMRIDRCFMAGSGVAQCHMWSDSSATDSEFTGGAIGLLMAAGGNRIVNIWANSCTNACVALRPFDNSTNHINTSIVNLYAGETYGINRPVIDIVGTGVNRVQQVHISNSFIVTAIASPNKIDGCVYMEYVKDVSIDNVQFRGVGSGYGQTSFTPFGVFASDNVDGLTISACTFRDINRNPIYLNSNIGSVNITGCSFQDWDIDQNAVAGEAAAIRISSGRVSATGNNFFIGGGQTQPYVVDVNNANMIVFDNNYMALPTPTLVAVTGTVSGFNRYSSGGAYSGRNVEINDSIIANSTVNNAKQNFQSRGQLSSSGGSTTTITTLANVAENQSYLITVRQSGGGANNVAAYVMAFGAETGAVRIAQSNAAGGALDMNITVSGLSIQLVLGLGFGLTTWDWVLTRLG